MSLIHRCLAWTCLGIVALLMAGCPFTPVLSVSPLTITLSETASTANFRIQNNGGGALQYEVHETTPWLDIAPGSVEKQDGPVTGSIGAGVVSFIQITVNRDLLPAQGVARGEIFVDSNAGSEVVIVTAQRSTVPVLQVSRTLIDFGFDDAEEEFVITNGGNGPLEWTVGVSAANTWLTATPLSGRLERYGLQASVAVRVNRLGLAARQEAYTAPITIISNGGNAEVTASALVPPFIVQPSQIDFGRTEATATQAITVTNKGASPVNLALALTTADGGSWLTVDNSSPVLPGSGSIQLMVTADPASLVPGGYAGSVRIDSAAQDYGISVPVTLNVPGFSVAPASIDFGSITETSTRTLTLSNAGSTPVAWQAVLSSASPWLQLSATSGSVTDTQEIIVTAVPGNTDPGIYSTDIIFNIEGGEERAQVTMTKPRPAALKVSPKDIDFGISKIESVVGIWNDGLGVVDWAIDTANFPAWLSLALVNGAAPSTSVVSGSVSGEQTDTIELRVDRSQGAPGQTEFNFSFLVQADGDAKDPVEVTVRASAPKLPVFELTGEGVDIFGIPYINFAIEEITQTLIISNPGQGTLHWAVDSSQTLPSWISSISPQQGEVDPGRQQVVQITVNREGLSRNGAIFRLVLTSNDPEPTRSVRVVEIQVRVPFKIVIGAKPTELVFGRFANAGILSVANYGDEGEYLNFKVTSTQPTWLFVDPTFGRSIGTAGALKDWQMLSVAIDRSRLNGQSASAKLLIEAVDVPPDALPVAPLEVLVSVDIAELTLESAVPMLRQPSLVRVNMLLRDAAFKTLPVFRDDYSDNKQVYRVTNVLPTIVEDAQALDLTEANVFVKKNELMPVDMLIMLDFSGSMQAVAQALVLDGQLPAGSGDPLVALYQQTIGALIDELPDHYRVGLAVFNERSLFPASPTRFIYTLDNDQYFVRDRVELRRRLEGLPVFDNGATELLPAIQSGAEALADLDADKYYLPFDSADEKFLLVITDGRRTTPPGEVGPYAEYLAGMRIRFMSVGWGDSVMAAPLIQLSSGTGGHYYSTENKRLEDGSSLPQVGELLKWCVTDAGDPGDQSIIKDLQSHITLHWVSLNESPTINLETRVEVLDHTPSIKGTAKFSAVKMANYANDVSLGQIGMSTEGLVSGGVTSSLFYLDYAPRNVNRLAVTVSVESNPAISPGNIQLEVMDTDHGGLLSDWTIDRNGNGKDFTFTAPAGRYLSYGDYGNLFSLHVDGATTPYKLRLNVTDPVYKEQGDGKYFTYADTMVVDGPTRATSFPLPYVTAVPGFTGDPGFTYNFRGINHIVDLDTPENGSIDQAKFTLRNLGGSHAPTGVWLKWLPSQGKEVLEGTEMGSFTLDPVLGGKLTLTEESDVLVVTPDRSAEPADYSGAIYFNCVYGTLGTIVDAGPYYVRYTITPPELGVSTNTLDFGTARTTIYFTVTNMGQSRMSFTIDKTNLPAWVTLNAVEYSLGPGESQTFAVTVDRTDVAPGSYTMSFDVDAGVAGLEKIAVLATVLP